MFTLRTIVPLLLALAIPAAPVALIAPSDPGCPANLPLTTRATKCEWFLMRGIFFLTRRAGTLGVELRTLPAWARLFTLFLATMVTSFWLVQATAGDRWESDPARSLSNLVGRR